MKHALLPFVAGLFLVEGSWSLDGEELSARAPYPSPRRSGENRVAFTSSNVQLLGWVPLDEFPGAIPSANDCWGYTSPSGREYAILGTSSGTGFVEVTDPGAPVVVDFEPGVENFWRCLRVYQHHAYVGSEGGGGIQVIDLTNIDAGDVELVATVTAGGCTTGTHTMAVDEVSGFLYRAGGHCSSQRQGLVMYDLSDPALPVHVGTWSGRYVHEVQVVTWDLPGPYLGREIVFAFTQVVSGSGTPRLEILDVTNKAAPVLVSSTAYPSGAFSHQGWTSADKLHLYLNDEQDDASFGPSRTRVFDIADLAAPGYVGFFSSGAGSIDHNLYVLGNRIYEGNYTSGLRIFDATVPTAPIEVAWFDTVPENDAQEFSSIWSNYPYFASGTLLGGDIERGLFVWREGPAELVLTVPGGVPESSDPYGEPLQFTVSENVPGDLEPGTVELRYWDGDAFTALAATSLGGELYEVTLPSNPCGTEIVFYLAARSTSGITWTDPPAGGTQVHMTNAAYGAMLAHQDAMEVLSGWMADLPADHVGFPLATDGRWKRVNPVGTVAQPEDDHTEAGTLCWVTGQAGVGDALGAADIDGGMTTLRSPPIDVSDVDDPYVSYWRWFSNARGTAPSEDTLLVDISGDGGASWVPLEVVGPTGGECNGGWFRHSARVADFVALTGDLCVRFRASDFGAGSIVEAAVDDLAVHAYGCSVSLDSVTPSTGPFEGGNVVTLTGNGFRAGRTIVRFGADLAQDVQVLSPTTLLARVPHARGPVGGKTGLAEMRVDVTVEDPGSVTLPRAYVYELRSRSR